MFSIDSILSGRPSCKEPLLLHRSGPVVLSAGLTDSIYTDYNGLYSATCGPTPPGVQSVNGTRIGYNGYYYGQLHVQGTGGGPPCCGSVPGLGPQQCPCIPAGRTGLAPDTNRVLFLVKLSILYSLRVEYTTEVTDSHWGVFIFFQM